MASLDAILGMVAIAADGKTLRGGFDAFSGRKTARMRRRCGRRIRSRSAI